MIAGNLAAFMSACLGGDAAVSVLAEVGRGRPRTSSRARRSRPRWASCSARAWGRSRKTLERPRVIPYGEIPHFPVSTAIGHKGELVLGRSRACRWP